MFSVNALLYLYTHTLFRVHEFGMHLMLFGFISLLMADANIMLILTTAWKIW